MNIDDLYTVEDHEAGAEMQIKDQFGALLDCYIKFAGIDSKTWRRGYAKSKRAIIRGEDETKALADALSNATISWRGLTSDGKDIPFSKEKAAQLYINAPYIMDQADTFIAARENFTKS